jgi:hypothetical protein
VCRYVQNPKPYKPVNPKPQTLMQELLDHRRLCIQLRTDDIAFIRRQLAIMSLSRDGNIRKSQSEQSELSEERSEQQSEPLAGAVDCDRVALIGHSYGGGTVVDAAQYAGGGKVSAVVMLDGNFITYTFSELPVAHVMFSERSPL